MASPSFGAAAVTMMASYGAMAGQPSEPSATWNSTFRMPSAARTRCAMAMISSFTAPDVAITFHGCTFPPEGDRCGGVCACSTCHVYVTKGFDQLSDIEDEEFDILDKAFDGKPELRRKVTLENPAKYFGLDLEAEITETPKA